MIRRKRNLVVWLALAVAVAAIAPMTAQARVSDAAKYPEWASELVAPYWFSKTESQRDYPAWSAKMVAPYSFSPVGTIVKSPDDRAFARTTTVDPAPVVSDDGRNIDFNGYTVSGLILTLLLAMAAGMGLGVLLTRKTRLLTA